MDLLSQLEKLNLLDIDDKFRNSGYENDRGRLFNDKAYQVKIEEQYERDEKYKYKQSGIPVEVHTTHTVVTEHTIVDGKRVEQKKTVSKRKLKINTIDLKKQLPTLKKGEPIRLRHLDDFINCGFDELQKHCIILGLGFQAWNIYDKLNRLHGASLLFDLELSHNSSIYSNKIDACNQVCKDQLWLDALVPQKYSQLEGDKALGALPDLIEDIDQLTKDNIVCLNDKLTGCQRSAIVNMIKAKNRPQPYLLFGPPGTGKTVTLAELVIQIFTRSQTATILVCGNSNICVDLLAQRIVNYGIFEEGEIVRLIASGRLDIDDAIPPEVKAITIQDGEFKRLETKPRIILATCQKSSLLPKCELNYLFDYVIVDEVGHCQEPETLIPVLLRRPEVGSIIFGGDPHQLQPVSKSPDAPLLKESILSRLFESEIYQKRLLGGRKYSMTPKYDERYITKLLDCHRSDARVMRVNNKLFYEDELKFTYKTPEVLLDIFQTRDPLLFSETVGKEDKLSTHDPSWMNDAEARRCINFVRLVYNGGYKADDVGIIAAYRSQVTYISSLFDKYNIERCKVASIDEFQGEEKEIIIISTVRSSVGKRFPQLGFLKEYQRFNVAVSRARGIVIVVGDPRLLRTDKNWQSYIDKATPVSLLLSDDSD